MAASKDEKLTEMGSIDDNRGETTLVVVEAMNGRDRRGAAIEREWCTAQISQRESRQKKSES